MKNLSFFDEKESSDEEVSADDERDIVWDFLFKIKKKVEEYERKNMV